MTVRRSERGVVLLAVLLVAALLATLGAVALRLLGDEFWAAGRRRAALQARYSAEAAVHHVAALLAPGRVLPAPPSSADLVDPLQAGPLLDLGGAPVPFPGEPFGYEARMIAAPPPGSGPASTASSVSKFIRVLGRGWSVAGTRRGVAGALGRARQPYLPAALVVTSGELVTSPTGLRLSGEGAARELASRGWPELDVAGRALGWEALWTERRGALARVFDVAAFARTSGLESVALPEGAPITLPATAARLHGGPAASLTGQGVLLVEGDLAIAGPIDFAGALFVSGTLRFAAEPCVVRGLVWARRVEVATLVHCDLAASLDALRAADAALALPRAVVVRGFVDTELVGEQAGDDPVALGGEMLPAGVVGPLATREGGQSVDHDQAPGTCAAWRSG